MELPRLLTPHTVTVKDFEGTGAYGDVYATPRTCQWVRVEEKTKLVRDKTGAEVVSSGQVFLRPQHAPVPLGSLVLLPSGRESRVLRVDHEDTRPAPEHYIAYLE
ncbi:hypothetical protein [Timonella senegalensis]|uniref:hypothetical protein n=1 Tax=Timonella senegalensis TaxID=1465825 RepID=UPI0028AD6283|nr:hypothetical protein [Timonella senegalensis]